MTGEVLLLVLLMNAAATWMLVGLIWFVQLVHYPLLDHFERARFAEYQSLNLRLTSRMVLLPMLIEAATAAILVWKPPSCDLQAACWAGFALVIAIWLSTAFLQMPRHDALTRGFDSEVHRGLVYSNWIRTILWSIRGVLVLVLLHQTLAKGSDYGG